MLDVPGEYGSGLVQLRVQEGLVNIPDSWSGT